MKRRALEPEQCHFYDRTARIILWCAATLFPFFKHAKTWLQIALCKEKKGESYEGVKKCVERASKCAEECGDERLLVSVIVHCEDCPCSQFLVQQKFLWKEYPVLCS